MRKGQFYMIGVVLVTGLILGVIGLRGGVFVTSGTIENLDSLFSDTVDEFSNTVGASLSEEDSRTSLEQDITAYVSFQHHVEVSHSMQPWSAVLVGRVNETGVDVSFGNFWQTDLDTAWVRVEDSAVRFEDVVDGGMRHDYLPASGDPLEVEVNFSSQRAAFNVSRNTFSMMHHRAEAGDQVWAATVVD